MSKLLDRLAASAWAAGWEAIEESKDMDKIVIMWWELILKKNIDSVNDQMIYLIHIGTFYHCGTVRSWSSVMALPIRSLGSVSYRFWTSQSTSEGKEYLGT